jgi:DNA-directed RNA polymerase specialized sigma24 family protein
MDAKTMAQPTRWGEARGSRRKSESPADGPGRGPERPRRQRGAISASSSRTGLLSPIRHPASLREQIDEALKCLTEREAEVIRLRFGLGEAGDHTLEEVGDKLQVTRERIRQIEAKALRKLQDPAFCGKLRSFS